MDMNLNTNRILKLGHIEACITWGNVINVYWDDIEKAIEKEYGKGWRLPTLEELLYIRNLEIDLGMLMEFDLGDEYWTSTPGTPEYIPDRNEFGEDLRWFYQVRMEHENPRNIDYSRGFLCHVDYYGNILPVRDI